MTRVFYYVWKSCIVPNLRSRAAGACFPRCSSRAFLSLLRPRGLWILGILVLLVHLGLLGISVCVVGTLALRADPCSYASQASISCHDQEEGEGWGNPKTAPLADGIAHGDGEFTDVYDDIDACLPCRCILFRLPARALGPQFSSGFGRKRATPFIFACDMEPLARAKLAWCSSGLLRIFQPRLPCAGGLMRWLCSQERMMSQTMLNGQSVLMPPGLQCVPETRYPALMIADLKSVLLGAEILTIAHKLEVVKKSGMSLSSSLTAVKTAATLSPQGYLPSAPQRDTSERVSGNQ